MTKNNNGSMSFSCGLVRNTSSCHKLQIVLHQLGADGMTKTSTGAESSSSFEYTTQSGTFAANEATIKELFSFSCKLRVKLSLGDSHRVDL